MPIYTRTGDRGKTSLGTGKRVWKDNLRVDVYGTIDELNSLLGLAISETKSAKKSQKYFNDILTLVQSDLFCLGSYFANPKMLPLIAHFDKRIIKFEQEIDFMMEKIPALRNFILPQGGREGALLQLARTVSRRAERKIVALARKERVNSSAVTYINRLSDLLLAMARYANNLEKKKEVIWSREKYLK